MAPDLLHCVVLMAYDLQRHGGRNGGGGFWAHLILGQALKVAGWLIEAQHLHVFGSSCLRLRAQRRDGVSGRGGGEKGCLLVSMAVSSHFG